MISLSNALLFDSLHHPPLQKYLSLQLGVIQHQYLSHLIISSHPFNCYYYHRHFTIQPMISISPGFATLLPCKYLWTTGRFEIDILAGVGLVYRCIGRLLRCLFRRIPPNGWIGPLRRFATLLPCKYLWTTGRFEIDILAGVGLVYRCIGRLLRCLFRAEAISIFDESLRMDELVLFEDWKGFV